MGGRPRIICDRSKVREMHTAGVSLGKIALELGLSKTTVHAIVMEA